MFDGFGLFGTGIGTGLFGKVEDMVLGVQCVAANARTKAEDARLVKRQKQHETQEQGDSEAETVETTAYMESAEDDRSNAEYEEKDKI